MFPTTAKWIADTSQKWPKKKSPIPVVFRKQIACKGKIRSAAVVVTAMGIYDLELNGKRLGDAWFAPGFTSYHHQLQYQSYDVTALLEQENTLLVTVAGGWAVGEFLYERSSRLAADHPSLLLEVKIQYEDGREETIPTDESWLVTVDGPVRAASWYDGETYDATKSLAGAQWHPAKITSIRGKPRILSQYGPPVTVWNTLSPVSVAKAADGVWIFDFGQNFAGVLSLDMQGRQGQTVTARHAELLKDGRLYTQPLRSAKAALTYTCREGKQHYCPRFTYMGFRYVEISGIEPENIKVTALALSSQLKETGSFACSNEMINRLNENIRWSARSNFIDIPTDCPQRDERLGWTGDISVFARTACWNYDMSSFLAKWLKDVRSEQGPFGGIPMVVPRNGHMWPPFTTACWADCCVLVPWAEYLARGDLELLRESYPSIRKFLRSVKRWAALFSIGKRRYIWQFLFQFGDWCAPQDPPEPWPKCVMTWMKRGKWIATAYFANSCGIAANIAELLGKGQDAAYYRALRRKICDAYRDVFTDGHGKLKEEFQTGYVLPLYFHMVEGKEAAAMADHLERLVDAAGNHLTTGFPSTPYLLFALSDYGHVDAAYRLLLQDTCPSWLYGVKMGATTIWERWDAIAPDGSLREGSCNHYAYGAVGDWLYRRVLGVEAASGGYKTFRIAPVPGGGLTWAKGHTDTPHGSIEVDWKIEKGDFVLNCTVPEGTECTLRMPSGAQRNLGAGTYSFTEKAAAR